MLDKSVKKYLLHGGVWAFGGKVITAISNMLIVALLARNLSHEDMSAFFIGQTIALFLAISGRFGLENTVLRFVSEFLSLGQNIQVKVTLRQSIKLVCIMSLIFASFYYFVIGDWVSNVAFHSPSLGSITGFLSVWSILLSFQFLYAEVFKAFKDIKRSVVFGGSFFSIISLILLVLLILFKGRVDLIQILLVFVFTGFINLVVGLRNIEKKVAGFEIAKIESLTSYSSLLSHSWPLWINSLTLFLLSQSGIWIVGLNRTGIEVAGYGAASRVILLASMSLVIINSILPPLIARYNIKNEKHKLEQLVRSTATIAALPAFFIFIFFLIIPEYLLIMIFGIGYEVAAPVLVILTIGQIVNIFVGSCGYVLIMSGFKTEMMLISIFSSIIAIASSFFVAQEYGAVGVAYCYLAGMVIQQLLMFYLAKIKVGIWTHISIHAVVNMIQSYKKVGGR